MGEAVRRLLLSSHPEVVSAGDEVMDAPRPVQAAPPGFIIGAWLASLIAQVGGLTRKGPDAPHGDGDG